MYIISGNHGSAICISCGARLSEASIETWTESIKVAVEGMGIDTTQRNVLVAYQFVIGSTRTESEHINVCGADNVDVSVFDAFDYVALGHLHSPQNCSSERVRYCGTLLKYSFSEVRVRKSVTVVELGKRGISASVRSRLKHGMT